jgi:hypothetical protein
MDTSQSNVTLTSSLISERDQQLSALSESISKIHEAIAAGIRRDDELERKIDSQNGNFINLVKQLNERDITVNERLDNLEARLINDNINININGSNDIRKIIKSTIQDKNRENNIIITGIKPTKGEKLKAIFGKICKKVGFQFTTLITAKRFQGKNHPFVVNFFDENQKNEFFGKYITVAKSLTMSSVFNNEKDNSRIWIQHDMDKSTYSIYKKALKMKNDQSIFSVHIKSNKIFIKKGKDDSKILISSMTDLDDATSMEI